MHLTEDGQYIIDSVVRLQKSPKYVEQTIKQTADIDGKSVMIWMEQEPGSGGVNTIDNYKRNVLPGFVFNGNKVSASKIDRAAPFASQAESGNVLLLNGAWISDFLYEFELFPDGELKDQVDSSSGAFEKLAIDRADVRMRWL
jgi:predicted phage terminase large subunit-like protein